MRATVARSFSHRPQARSKNTVSEVLEIAGDTGIRWPLEDDVSNEELQSILFPGKFASTSGYMETDYDHIHTELAKPGVKMTLLWTEYNEKCAACVEPITRMLLSQYVS